jgi:hypothetical protein
MIGVKEPAPPGPQDDTLGDGSEEASHQRRPSADEPVGGRLIVSCIPKRH